MQILPAGMVQEREYEKGIRSKLTYLKAKARGRAVMLEPAKLAIAQCRIENF
jgi:hypothetical protein